MDKTFFAILGYKCTPFFWDKKNKRIEVKYILSFIILFLFVCINKHIKKINISFT